MKELEGNLIIKIELLRRDLTIRLGGILALNIGVIATLI